MWAARTPISGSTLSPKRGPLADFRNFHSPEVLQKSWRVHSAIRLDYGGWLPASRLTYELQVTISSTVS